MMDYHSDIMEQWKDIEGYEGKYQVSNEGRVKSLNYHQQGIEQVLRLSTSDRGYKRVALQKDGKCKLELVHRLVAKAFIPNPNNYPIINHKDENTSNNFVDNLEWCTSQYNNTYNDRHLKAAPKIAKSKSGLKLSDATRKHMSEAHKKRFENGETIWNKGLPSSKRKPVEKYNIKTGETIKTFDFIIQAASETGCNVGHIIDCCKGRRNNCGGFGWRYA